MASWLLASHCSEETGHALALQALGLTPLIGIGLRLGEGSGAALCVPLLQLAIRLHNEMATFAEVRRDGEGLMFPYTLTLLRHGDIDHEGRLIGQTDLPANDSGITQMARSWQRLNSLAPVTSMATSPLQRCREFAVYQALQAALPLKVDERFAEIDFGDWDGMSLNSLSAQHPDWRQALVRHQLVPPGGESYALFRQRVLEAFTTGLPPRTAATGCWSPTAASSPC
ncbi:histidine phosphatase family protein [Paludibacterium denitrificans]|uniref:histidine phosphatase family protein n=1 Tax=Paludibacterium denitrificans TaxID=2675226 RepID=UPI0028ADCD81|nr:histidine phosphatase family protein [Paludibacterium denitrificans]